MKKTLLICTAFLACSNLTYAQDVTIPDVNFKAYLVGNSAINTNADTEIQVSEAAAFAGDIFGNNLGIADLTGIEAFTSLTGLYVRDNNLGSFDVSANTALTYLDCQNTSISALDITANTSLTGITCAQNNLTTLDVSNNVALTAINCGNNDLTSLDVSNNVLLSNFSCDNNDLTSIDVSNNTALLYFVCFFNNLTSIDVSNCTALAHFACSGNSITSLDVSNNLALGALYVGVNNISLLDLGANTSLQILNCTDNDLSILNVANGNNMNVSLFAASGNANLTCIQVDDDVWSTSNWTAIDPTASFSTDCDYGLGLGNVDASQNLFVYPNPTSSQLTIEIAEKVISARIIDAMGRTNETSLTTDNTIDVSELPNGVYLLQLDTNKGLVQKRFVKND